jgi:hypothetical protein
MKSKTLLFISIILFVVSVSFAGKIVPEDYEPGDLGDEGY